MFVCLNASWMPLSWLYQRNSSKYLEQLLNWWNQPSQDQESLKIKRDSSCQRGCCGWWCSRRHWAIGFCYFMWLQFAKDVLIAIKNESEKDLLERNVRRDSIKATQWPEMLSQFVFTLENSRSVPGQDTVSIRYSVRRPKYLLLKSKWDIAANFKTIHPDCLFYLSTLISKFLQNAVTPTTRDLQGNTCPTRANAHRIVKCLHKNGVAKHVSTSCREMATLSMCEKSHVDPSNPYALGSWEEKCVFGECEKCPQVNIDITTNHVKAVKLSLCGHMKCPKKRTKMYLVFFLRTKLLKKLLLLLFKCYQS